MTPATAALDAAGVEYVVTAYELDGRSDDGYGLAAAEALGFDPSAVGKTLVAEVDGSLVAAVIPTTGRLSLKLLARAVGGKTTRMASADAAERAAGSKVGAISPLGFRRPIPVIVDQSLIAQPVVHVSAGRRGLELSLSPGDLVRATGATVARLH